MNVDATQRVPPPHRSPKLASNANAVRLLDFAFEQPILNVRMAEQQLGCAYVTAASTIDLLVEKKALRETTGRKRNRIFRFDALLDLFQQQLPPCADGTEGTAG